jgi:hypothetical protein
MSRQPAVPRKFEDFLKKRDEYNIIFPSEKVLEISPVHKLIPEVIRISADPEDGDVWRVGYGTDQKKILLTSGRSNSHSNTRTCSRGLRFTDRLKTTFVQSGSQGSLIRPSRRRS